MSETLTTEQVEAILAGAEGMASLATELLAQRKRVEELEAWQDISTAPKDGTVVLGWWKRIAGTGPDHSGEMEYRADWWWPLTMKPYTGWCVPRGGPTGADPSGWMPLPTPKEPS